MADSEGEHLDGALEALLGVGAGLSHDCGAFRLVNPRFSTAFEYSISNMCSACVKYRIVCKNSHGFFKIDTATQCSTSLL
jgi:hypothetical protein